MRISDWSSDVCSSDLRRTLVADLMGREAGAGHRTPPLQGEATIAAAPRERQGGLYGAPLMERPSAPVAGGLAGGGDTVGGADHDDGERVGLVELLGDALGLLQGHRLDVAVALFQVVDASVLDLHAHEHAGDIVGAAEAQRNRAGEVALGGDR